MSKTTTYRCDRCGWETQTKKFICRYEMHGYESGPEGYNETIIDADLCPKCKYQIKKFATSPPIPSERLMNGCILSEDAEGKIHLGNPVETPEQREFRFTLARIAYALGMEPMPENKAYPVEAIIFAIKSRPNVGDEG